VGGGTGGAVPLLGERGGNAAFLIDGMPNSNLVDGGSAAPTSQDSILEFQALTSGYKAEFGHGSGGIVHVVTRSGNNEWHGLGSVFHRNDANDYDTHILPRSVRRINVGVAAASDDIFSFESPRH